MKRYMLLVLIIPILVIGQNSDRKQLSSEMVKDRLERAVKDGKLTQTQADLRYNAFLNREENQTRSSNRGSRTPRPLDIAKLEEIKILLANNNFSVGQIEKVLPIIPRIMYLAMNEQNKNNSKERIINYCKEEIGLNDNQIEYLIRLPQFIK
tara:strand:- start:554 stop:1009 length:456 start_codon:yes stop_codon:yes gene_type:complete